MDLHTDPPPAAHELAAAFATGRCSAAAIVDACLDRIAAREPLLHAWAVLDVDAARARAAALDARRATGAMLGPLAAVPLGVKDLLDTADLPTAYGSPIYRHHRPAADAGCVARVRGADAIVLGKTVTAELAYFTPGPTANPHDPAHTPGGSSSGSAAAVAAGMVPLAFGTQTAGSVIRPASFCGVFGIKPTFASIDLRGAKPFAPSLDTLGWFARSADDLELMRSALTGEPFAPLEPMRARLAAWATDQADLLDAGGADAWERGLRLASDRGSVVPFDPPAALADLFEAQKVVMAYEAVRSLAWEWRERADELSAALRALLDEGAAIDEARYRQALTRAEAARAALAQRMRDVDALLVPSAPGEAPRGLAATGDPAFSRVWTLLGLPCVNVPGLRGPRDLPIGVQLVGHAGGERALLAAAADLHRRLTRAATWP